MQRRALLTAMAAIELGAGLLLLVAPALMAGWLFGAMPEVPTIGLRVLGLVLSGLGLMCWLSRDGAALRPFRIMLGYNALAALGLIAVGLAWAPVGGLLWPAVILHAGLAGLQVRDMLGARA